MSTVALPSAADRPTAWRPRSNPWWIAIAVMLGTFMEVMDTSIANVALPHIAGSMSITTHQATWVLTSYLISNAIVLTAADWFSRTFGRKRFLLSSIGVFVGASLAAGLAPNIGFLLVALVIQGLGGGALQPTAQAILLESFPARKRGQAMAFYVLGVICAPVIGPTLGGWLTDAYSWRWMFYINIPVGAVAFLMVDALVEDPPHIRDAVKTRIDVVGFALLAIWIAALQIMLDKGQDAGWFGAVWIRWLAGLAAVGFLAFVAWELTTATPLINLRILKNRNFASCTAVMILVAMILYSTTALLPMFLQTLMGYPALQSGLAVSPRGLGSVVGVLIAGRWMSRVDERFFMAASLVALAWSSYLLGSINLNIGMFSVTWPIIINGFAVSMLFIPLTTVSVSTLRQDQIGNATSIYNLVRNLGGAIGISVTTALLSQISQARQSLLVRHATALNPAWRRSVQRLQTVLAPHGPAATMRRDAFAILYHQISQQVNTLAFIDDFRLLALLALACLPLVLMLRPPRHHHLAL